MTNNEQQEKEVKELAEDLLKCIEDCGIHYLDCPVYLKGGQMDIKLNQCKKCFAQHLISKGYRKAGELHNDFHTELMSLSCKDSYQAMQKQVHQLLIKYRDLMIAQRDHDREA